MWGRNRAMVLLVLVASGAALAQAGGSAPDASLDAPECLRARQSLEAATQASLKDRAGNAARLASARAAAGEACLGRTATPSTGARGVAAPALVVPPVRATAPAALPGASPPGALAAPLPPVVIPGPTVINSCDATGCWDSGGTRLQQSGPMLSGPRGLCSVQGSFVSCP